VWVKELRRIVGPDIVLVIAGNKADLMKRCQVELEEAKTYADSVQAQHILVSAKTGKNIDQAFLEITKQMLQKESERPESEKTQNNNRTLIGISNEMEQTNTGCC